MGRPPDRRTREANLDSHKVEAFWEDYQFLKEQDMTDEQIARRLGVTAKTLERRLNRRRNRSERTDLDP